MDVRPLLLHPRRARAVAAACITLAAGGIVLARAPGGSLPNTSRLLRPALTSTPSGGQPQSNLRGPGLHGSLHLSQGAVTAGAGRSVLAELRLSAERGSRAEVAPPVALAVVLDISGSMSGEKLEQARAAVSSLVNQMRGEDYFALVTYSDSARVVQPLARVAESRARLAYTIPTIQVEGGTNIPAGLAAGAESLAAAPAGMVRRIVLLSDGNDTSGRPLEFTAAEVRARADQGVTVSALGIGADYSEPFMTRMADAGRGNYEFLRDGAQVGPFLARELRQSVDTAVQNAVATARFPSNWRLVRAYGVEAQTPAPGTVTLPVGSLFVGDERRVVLEFNVDAPSAGGSAGALALGLRYNVGAGSTQVPAQLDAEPLALRVVGDERSATASRDGDTFTSANGVVLAARQQQAVEAWRQGNAAEAARLAVANAQAVDALRAAAPTAAAAAAFGAQAAEYRRESSAFGSLSNGSEAGRAFGLSANARHRAAQSRAASY